MILKQQDDDADESKVEQSLTAAAKPKSRRRLLQFPLLALFLLMIPMAFAAFYLRGWLDDRPVDWKPYSKVELDQRINDEDTVLVFMSAAWNPTSKDFEEAVFQSQRIKEIIRSRGIVPMRADYSNQHSIQAAGELRDLALGVNRAAFTPNFVIFPGKSGGRPEVLTYSDVETIEELVYTALEKHSSR